MGGYTLRGIGLYVDRTKGTVTYPGLLSFSSFNFTQIKSPLVFLFFVLA